MEIYRLVCLMFFLSNLPEVSFAMSRHETSNKQTDAIVPWTEVGFFIVLLLDVVALIALLVVIKYKKKLTSGISYQKALKSETEVRTPIYIGPDVHQELQMDRRFYEYNAVSQIDEIDNHFKPSSSESLYDSVSETHFLNHS